MFEAETGLIHRSNCNIICKDNNCLSDDFDMEDIVDIDCRYRLILTVFELDMAKNVDVLDV